MISSQSGVILDPVYTVKAVNGMLTEMSINPQRFKGKRVLFIHTGRSFHSSLLGLLSLEKLNLELTKAS